MSLIVLILLSACNDKGTNDIPNIDSLNLIHDIAPFTDDSLVHIVVEIPAGTNQKWEVSKTTGQIEWEKISPDSFRVINYLPYPANYGFVPQTLLTETNHGDGDPVDVFVLGPASPRGGVTRGKIIGIIHMLDDQEMDSKLLAVDVENPVLAANSLETLLNDYPGVIEILKLWLLNYKGRDRIEILSIKDEKDGLKYLREAHGAYVNSKNN